ncbi:PREDICTED: platelet glycoprotein Ib alpha chain-like [Camelina sativa]|uniref:Platelet glycoprotein Ib alpha chain-like n=1 Tax=Camelina sativa TaxID=90675 RepID=A0ABM1Q7E9_CAMSA|nr:PREDICTED: platelet glycoprotein Ib alpha chain-like [Camelina sativa]
MWYIGECMFLIAQWDSSGGEKTDLDAIPIWTHLKGMPFDLMHRKGISLVAGLVGEPKEMDEFTKNLVSLSVAHVKVERNLNESLPSSVKVVRDSGEVITINVEYPWIPPTCSHCHEIGHIIIYCSLVTPSWTQKKQTTTTEKSKETASVNKSKGKLTTDSTKPTDIAGSSSVPPPLSDQQDSPSTLQLASEPIDVSTTSKPPSKPSPKKSSVPPPSLHQPAITTSNPYDILAPSPTTSKPKNPLNLSLLDPNLLNLSHPSSLTPICPSPSDIVIDTPVANPIVPIPEDKPPSCEGLPLSH